MKNRLDFRFLLLPVILLAMAVVFTKCTHEDEVIGVIVDTPYVYGDDVIKVSDGFLLSTSHSLVAFSSPYQGFGAPFTGSFDDITLVIEFIENDPANSSLSGSVVLSSVNTGSDGRDDGCLATTLGTTADGPETAEFTSTSITYDNDGGYDVEGTMTFHGFTNTINGKLIYLGTNRNAAGTRDYASFSFEFDFLCKTDFGIESGNVADNIHVTVYANYYIVL